MSFFSSLNTWYRAPEVLLHSSSYTSAIDLWAIGVILAELFTLSPLFPGESETDQLYKICCVLGTPDWITLPEGMNLSCLTNFSFLEIAPADLSDLIPNASLEAIDLIMVGMWVPRPLPDTYKPKPNFMGSKPKLELKLWDSDTEPDDCFLGLSLEVKPRVSNLEVAHQVSHNAKEEIVFCSTFQDQSDQSVWWPLLSSDQSANVQTKSFFPSSYTNSQFPCPTIGIGIGVQPSAGFTLTSLQL